MLLRRFCLLIWTLTALSAAVSWAQPLTCVAGAGVATLLRAESRTDFVGDVVISCTGGDPTVVNLVNIDVFVNTNITSNIVDPNNFETEALLLIDDPLPSTLNRSNNVEYFGQVRGKPGIAPGFSGAGAEGSGNVYVAQRAPFAENRLSWNGVPIVAPPPGGQRILRIVNVRANASAFPPATEQPAIVSMFLSVSPQSSLLISTPQIRVGTVVPSVEFATVAENSVQVRFRERLATAFRKRIENAPGVTPEVPLPQNIPGQPFSTESGFNPDFGGTGYNSPGVADTGTRLLVEFRDLPDGTLISAPSSVLMTTIDEDPTKLLIRRVDNFDITNFASGSMVHASQPPALITSKDGIARIVYEVAPQAPYTGINGASVVEQVVIPFDLATPPGTTKAMLEKATVAGGFAPIDPTVLMSAPAPEPRFVPLGPGQPLFLIPTKQTLSFTYVTGSTVTLPLRGRTRPDNDLLTLSNSILVDTQLSGDWLKATPDKAPATATITVEVDPTGLPVGSYQGTIRVQLEDQSFKFLTVTLTVLPAPELLIDTAPLTFSYRVGDPAPPSQIVYLTAKIQAVDFTATATTETGTGWLSVTPSSGGTPKNLQISVDPTGLRPGAYKGAIQVVGELAVNNPQIIPITLNVTIDRPYLSSDGILNGASYVGGPVAPGEIVTLYGLAIGPPDAPGTPDLSQGAPTAFRGVQVFFDGIPAPLLYVSANQINLIAPFGIEGRASTNVAAEFNGKRSDPVPVNVASAKPGIFTLNFMGTGQAAALNQDGTINGLSNPAGLGTLVSLFLTGGGPTNPAGQDGKLIPIGTLPVVTSQVEVTIGGKPAIVQYAGGAPGLLNGVIQINAYVPGEIELNPQGVGATVPVTVRIAGQESQPGATLVVR